MYRQFQLSEEWQNEGAPCVYNIYREECKRLHISTATLGSEECVSCDTLTGEELLAHKRAYRAAREEYYQDREDGIPCYTMDLQKVIMLPRLEQYQKVCSFT